MKWPPHNYQLSAVGYLLSNPLSGLFLDPGLGKTSITLSTISILKHAQKSNGVLLIAPLRVIYSVWPDEITKWDNFNHLSSVILHGKSKSKLWGKSKDIYLINPEGLPWLFNELLDGLQSGKSCPFDILWIDESTKFKSHTSKTRFELIKDMLPLFKRRHIMTGTPAPRSLIDLWPQIFILDQGKSLSPNFYKFRNKYFESNDWNKYSWFIKEGCDTEIHNAIAPLILEMASKDYLELPDVIYNDILVNLPDKAFKQYKQMEKEFFVELDDGDASAEATAQVSMKCHQMANGIVYEDVPVDLTEEEEKQFRRTRKSLPVHKAKLEALKDLIEELNGKPLLIAYHYKHDLLALKKMLGQDTPHIGSGLSQEQIEDTIKEWNKGNTPVLLGHPVSMAHGLNLQAGGNDICWYSLTWNLEDYIQFNARIYRQGVKGSVRIHHLISNGTIDQAMLMRLGSKAKEQQNLRDALRDYLLETLSK